MRLLKALFLVFLLYGNAYALSTDTFTIKASGGNYTTLEAALDDNEQDLTSTDKIIIFEISGAWSGDDTTQTTINGYTTDATRYIHIRAIGDSTHNPGVWNSTGYIINTTGLVWTLRVQYGAKYTKIEGMQLKGSTSALMDISLGNASDSMVEIWNCMFDGDNATGTLIGQVGSCRAQYWNNIIFNGQGDGIGLQYPYQADIYNNTFHTLGTAVDLIVGTSGGLLKNNIAQNISGLNYDEGGTFISTSTHNIADDTSAPLKVKTTTSTATSTTSDKLVDSTADFGNEAVPTRIGMRIKNTTDTTYANITAIDSTTTLSIDSDIMADTEGYEIYTAYCSISDVSFVGAGYADLHLKSDDTRAIDMGANLYGDALPITTDIDADARPNSNLFDIGADEYVSGAPPSYYQVITTVMN